MTQNDITYNFPNFVHTYTNVKLHVYSGPSISATLTTFYVHDSRLVINVFIAGQLGTVEVAYDNTRMMKFIDNVDIALVLYTVGPNVGNEVKPEIQGNRVISFRFEMENTGSINVKMSGVSYGEASYYVIQGLGSG